jgi:hypothetical protein
MLPWSSCPLAGQSIFGQNVVCGSMAHLPSALSTEECHAIRSLFQVQSSDHRLAYTYRARLFGDKAYNSAPDETTILDETGVRVIPMRRANMQPHAWFLDDIELREYRHTIETVNTQCEKMGLERLYARTNPGFELKVLATIIALSCTNMNSN